MPGAEDVWQIQIEKDVKLFNSSGVEVPLPYAALYEVLRAVAMSPSRVISRRELGQQLWGSSSTECRQRNVRQAIYRLKSILGSHAFLADRHECGLGEGVEVVAKLHLRRNLEPFSKTGAAKDECLPIHGFLQLLKWLGQNNSQEMFDLMRSNLHYCYGIAPSEIALLLTIADDKAKKGSWASGWKLFWAAQSELPSNLAKARLGLGAALEMGRQHCDSILIAEAIYWLTVVEILSGRSRSAQNLMSLGRDLRSTLKSRELRSQLLLVEGNVLLHEGLAEKAVAAYSEANGAARVGIQWAQTEALLALFKTCSGKVEDAMNGLIAPRRMAKETGHAGLDWIVKLSDGYAALAQREWESALATFSTISDSSGHFSIYAREGETCALVRLGYRGEAEERLQLAKAQRKSTHMAYTNWDRKRMRFASVVGQSLPA